MTEEFDDRIFESFKERIVEGEEGAAEAFNAWNDERAERFDEKFEELVADVPDWAVPTGVVRNYVDTAEAQEERRSEAKLAYADAVTRSIVWPSDDGGPPIIWDGDDLLSPDPHPS